MENIKENQQVLPNEEENFSLHGLLNQVDENNVQPEINQTVEQETTTTNDVIVNDEPVDKKDEALNHLNDYASMMKEKEEQVRIDYEKKVADERVQSALLEKQANAKNNFNDNIIEMDDDEEKEIENTTAKKRKRAEGGCRLWETSGMTFRPRASRRRILSPISKSKRAPRTNMSWINRPAC